MPIMALFRSPKVDQTTYDRIIEALDLERNPPAGSLSHVAGFDAGGACVVDVWESRREFDDFLRNRLNPVFQKLKVDIQPPTVIETYAFNVTDEVDRYKQPIGEAASARPSTGERPSANP